LETTKATAFEYIFADVFMSFLLVMALFLLIFCFKKTDKHLLHKNKRSDRSKVRRLKKNPKLQSFLLYPMRRSNERWKRNTWV